MCNQVLRDGDRWTHRWASLDYLASSRPLKDKDTISKNKVDSAWGMAPEADHAYVHTCTWTHMNMHIYYVNREGSSLTGIGATIMFLL